jgi:NADPH-dependent 7-cyano-7-deazaguanine reductase QueF-like protein
MSVDVGFYYNKCTLDENYKFRSASALIFNLYDIWAISWLSTPNTVGQPDSNIAEFGLTMQSSV